jgi:hypothetical protein
MFRKFDEISNICKKFSINKKWAVRCENDSFNHVRYSFPELLLVCLNNVRTFFIVSNLIQIIASSTCQLEKANVPQGMYVVICT